MDKAFYRKWHDSSARNALRRIVNGGRLADVENLDESDFTETQWRQLNAAAAFLSDRRAAAGNKGLPLVRGEADRLSALILAGTDDLKFTDDDEVDASEAAERVFVQARGW